MTAIVLWPGATAQQIQDEVLNRMEKKFEQLDHFEKVVTYARQGYGAMLVEGIVAGEPDICGGRATGCSAVLPLRASRGLPTRRRPAATQSTPRPSASPPVACGAACCCC